MARRSIFARVFALPLAIRLGVVIAVVALVGSLTLVGTGVVSLGGKPESLAITPSAALLPSVGATRALVASTVDASGKAAPVTATWTSSHPDVVAVDATGTITAKALGSAQVTATAQSLTSSPILVVVAEVAAGVTLVDDSQVIESPLDPGNGAATSDETYQASLKGFTPKVGDRLFGTGEQPVAGEVVEVMPAGDSTIATLRLVPLPELLPNLEIDERIPLTAVPVEVVPEVARLYDVVRVGTKFTFTPKANFQQLVEQTPASSSSGRTAGPALAMAATDVNAPVGESELGVGVPVGTHMLPFSECELKSDTVSDEGPRFLPFRLSEGPKFEVEIDPFYEVQWSDEVKHLVLGASPKVKLTLGLQVDASFKATYECKATLFTFPVPITGPLSWFISGLVPIGAGFEVGGEVTLASAKASITIEATGTLGIGFDCAEGQGCRLVHELDASLSKPPEWTVKLLPTAANLRFKPSIEAFGFVEAAVGNPASRFKILRFLDSLKLKAAEAKFGPKVELDWAPHAVQIADSKYSSEFKATFELGVEAGADLKGIADRLGLGDILSTGLEKSIDLEGSPKGSMDLSKVKLIAGQPVTVTVGLTQNVAMLAIYNVSKVVLVRSTGGTKTALGSETVLATTTATAGQTDFDLTFTPTQDMKMSELHAFVVTKFPPGDVIDFELERSLPNLNVLAFLCEGSKICTIQPDGSGRTQLDVVTPNRSPPAISSWSADGLHVLYGASNPNWVNCEFLDLTVADADGLNPKKLWPGTDGRWSPDGSRIVFTHQFCNASANPGPQRTEIIVANADGSNRRTVATSAESPEHPVWSPDGSQVAYVANHASIVIVNSDGTGRRVVKKMRGIGWPDWSPDGKTILFTRVNIVSEGTVEGALDTDLYVIGIDGSGMRQLTSGLAWDNWPAWSPDGTRVAFVRASNPLVDNKRQVWDVFLVNADGSSVVSLTNDQNLGGYGPLIWGP